MKKSAADREKHTAYREANVNKDMDHLKVMMDLAVSSIKSSTHNDANAK